VRRIEPDRSLPARYGCYFIAVYREALRADVVYLQDPLSSGLPGWIGARLARKPVLLKVVGDAAWEVSIERGLVSDDFQTYQRKTYPARVELIRKAQRAVARRADRIIVPSRFLKEIVTAWGVEASLVDVVPNSLQPETESPPLDRNAAKERLGLAGRIVVFSASRLVPWKGFDSLVRLAAGMKNDLPEVRWLLAGSGPCEGALRRSISVLGVDASVKLVGALSREQMALHLAACDLFVLWSGYEGFSHVLLEALGAGRAIVASDAGGNPEILETGRNGLVVPWKNEGELGRAITSLCRNLPERERLEREAAAAAARFAWPAMVQRTLGVLGWVAGS
jgi:glycosyltransferase involved in cell wall biosynthesis